MPDVLTPDDFRMLTAPLLVEVTSGPAVSTVPMTVREIVLRPPHRFREAPFTLYLAGPSAPLLPQGTYGIRHPTLGVIALFIVPMGRNAESAQYEVTFN